jgi:hypothetical protein
MSRVCVSACVALRVTLRGRLFESHQHLEHPRSEPTSPVRGFGNVLDAPFRMVPDKADNIFPVRTISVALR